jgi:hypothetical protein
MKKIILSTKRFVNSPEVDYYQRIQLDSKSKNLLNENTENNIELSELFNQERENSYKYRIIGKFEYLSILNNLKKDYITKNDFFIRYINNSNVKNIFNSFKIYLVYKSDAYVNLGNDKYKETYDIISELSDIQIYNCGFSKNIFNEQNYLYNFNIEFDIKDKTDYFNKPITDVYLYFDYQLDTSKNEILIKKEFNQSSNENNNINVNQTINNNYNINDLITGNLIKKEDDNFDEDIINEQIHKIKMFFGNNEIQFKFNPFIKIKLREYNDTIYFGNINSNTKNIVRIPDYAKPVGDISKGNVIWKELLPHGYIDPISEAGVNHPFINGIHYVYTNNILGIQPDLTNFNTEIIFNKVKLNGFLSDLFILNNPGEEEC